MCASREFVFFFYILRVRLLTERQRHQKPMNSFMKFDNSIFIRSKLVFVNAFNKRSTCHSLVFFFFADSVVVVGFLNLIFCVQRSFFCLKYERLLIFCVPQVVSKLKLSVQSNNFFF